jgi:hypothetical protein
MRRALLLVAAILIAFIAFHVSNVFAQEAGSPFREETEEKTLPPLEKRDAAKRPKYVQLRGGTKTSEAAVASALKWLALHQRKDGSWSFDHRDGPCKSNPGGLVEAFNGATALALLPYLGAGQTHKQGNYKEAVKSGLAYLVRSTKIKEGKLGDLTDGGTMYSHGLATIVLCEAYALTEDHELLAPAQAAINYIAFAQDPVGGGWRYTAKTPGDTSVTGWQVQALHAGKLAGLKIPDEAFKGAHRFLDKVQTLDGARYGYTAEGSGVGTTAEGLYCRSLLGWNVKENKPLVSGIDFVSKLGPSKNNFYFNYYATQLLRHNMTDEWRDWNEKLRDSLVASQAKEDAERGSWYLAGDHGSERGGRIYCTAMATLILESYYRSYSEK